MQRWQLRQMCFPAGCHQPKREPYKYVYVPPKGIIQPYQSYGSFSGFDWKDRKGNLENDEYRLFMGDISKASVRAQCRICFLSMYTKEERKTHPKTTGCYKAAIFAYTVLLAKGNCVVCGKPTKNKKWGIPLCAGETIDTCIDRWKFYTLQPQIMRDALPKKEPLVNVTVLTSEDY